MSQPKIAVLGPGAVGGLLAARLSRLGHEVTILAREQTAAAITVRGLELQAPSSSVVTARPHARAWLTDPVDVLLVAVKANDLLAALPRAPASMLAGAVVVPLLNGTDHMPLLRSFYPAADVIAATISVEATRHGPGIVEQVSTFANLMITAPPSGPGPGRDVADLLSRAGFEVRTHEDETLVLWRKLAMLAPFALLTTSAQAPLGEARSRRSGWLEPLVAEAAAAAEACGAAVDADAIEAQLRKMPPEMRSSMLKDLSSGRPLELDAIAGPIIRAISSRAEITSAAVAEILDHLADER